MHVSSAYRFEAVSRKACSRSLISFKKRSGCRNRTLWNSTSNLFWKNSLQHYKEFFIRKIGFEPSILTTLFFQAKHFDLRYQMPFLNQLISFQYVA